MSLTIIVSMGQDWRKNLLKLMEQRRLSMKELSLSSGLGETAVRDMLERRPDPRLSSVRALTKSLGISLSELVDGEPSLHQQVPIIGAIAAGEGWVPYDDGLGEVDMVVDGDPIALEVRGESMVPVYRPGDVLIGSRHSGSNIGLLVGRDCMVVTDDGERYVKFIIKGAMRGRFNLRSYNPAQKDIENVLLTWAAPVLWVRRAQR